MRDRPLRKGDRVWVELSGRVVDFNRKRGERRIVVEVPSLGYENGRPIVLALRKRHVLGQRT